MREGVTPFDYYWQSHGALLDAFVRESGEYRKAVDGGEAPERGAQAPRRDREFMRKLRVEIAPGSRLRRHGPDPRAKSRPGSAAAISSASSTTTWPRPRASPARPSSPIVYARRWSTASRPSIPTWTR
jgi:hypothetical protein